MSWESPTGYEDPDGAWVLEPYAYDDNEATYASADSIPLCTWPPLILTISAIQCNRIRILLTWGGLNIDTVQVAVRRDGSWVVLYSGAPWTGWQEFSFTQGSVDAMRIAPHASDALNSLCVFEADFWMVAPPAVVGYYFGDGLVTIQT